MSNVHHAISLKRKYEVNPVPSEDCRKASNKTQITEYLFGTDFLSQIKSHPELKKVGADLKKSTKREDTSAAGPSRYLNVQRPFKKQRFPHFKNRQIQKRGDTIHKRKYADRDHYQRNFNRHK